MDVWTVWGLLMLSLWLEPLVSRKEAPTGLWLDVYLLFLSEHKSCQYWELWHLVQRAGCFHMSNRIFFSFCFMVNLYSELYNPAQGVQRQRLGDALPAGSSGKLPFPTGQVGKWDAFCWGSEGFCWQERYGQTQADLLQVTLSVMSFLPVISEFLDPF